MNVYLDHAAATPMRDSARAAWLELAGRMANPSSIHADGQAARRLLEDARERIAALLDADPVEIVFTSGGTESINLALKGMWWARAGERGVIVLPDGEHHATMDTVEWLRREQTAIVRSVPLSATGAIRVDAFADALGPDVAFATAIVANNEVGTINDTVALAAAATGADVPLHLDAVAALGHTDISFRRLQSTRRTQLAMSVSAHKIGGPPSFGALAVSRTTRMTALQHGGASQRDLRAGTQDVAGAVAFAVALEEVEAERAEADRRTAGLRDRLMAQIVSAVPSAVVLGDRSDRLPGNVHVLFPGAPGESMLYLLDREGIAVSTGSACQAGIAEASHVVQAMGYSEADARSVLRMSLSSGTTEADIRAVERVIATVYDLAAAGRS